MNDNDIKNVSCCDMRLKVAIGIAKIYSEAECGISDSIMLDYHDFDYKSPTNLPVSAALSIKYCPWCGASRDQERDEDRRVVEIIRSRS